MHCDDGGAGIVGQQLGDNQTGRRPSADCSQRQENDDEEGEFHSFADIGHENETRIVPCFLVLSLS